MIDLYIIITSNIEDGVSIHSLSVCSYCLEIVNIWYLNYYMFGLQRWQHEKVYRVRRRVAVVFSLVGCECDQEK